MTNDPATPGRTRTDNPLPIARRMDQPRRRSRRAGRAVLAAALLAFAGPPARAQDAALCAPLGQILAAAPKEFRALRDSEYSTKFESWRANLTLDGFDACWIDDVSRAFWCVLQAPDMAVAETRAASTLDAVSACLPTARRDRVGESMDNNVTRQITDWIVDDARRLRLVHRYPTKPPGLAAVFLYVY